MSDIVQTAPAEPVAQAQNPAEKQSGSSNAGMNDFARKLAAKQTPPAAFAQAVQTVKEEAKAELPKTEETQVPPAEVKEEPTVAEAETPPETEEESETEEVLSPETHTLDPKLQAKIDRRIGKEVKKRKDLEAEVAQLKALVAERPQEVEKEVEVPVATNVPLANITSLDALNQYRDALQNDILEAEMLLHTDFPQEGKQTKWGVMTKDTLIAALTQAKKDERIAIPAREKFLTTRTQASQAAIEKFPFLKDPTHPGYQMAKTTLRDNPVLRTYPNSEYLVGMIVKGQLAMQEEEAPKKASKPKPQPTKGQGEFQSDASITRAPTGLMDRQALQVERAKVAGGKKSLGHKDFAQLLVANQRFRNSQ